MTPAGPELPQPGDRLGRGQPHDVVGHAADDAQLARIDQGFEDGRQQVFDPHRIALRLAAVAGRAADDLPEPQSATGQE